MFWPGGHCATRAGHEHLPPRVREEGQGNSRRHGSKDFTRKFFRFFELVPLESRARNLTSQRYQKKREDLIVAISVRRLPCHSHSQVRWLVERQATMINHV